MKKTLMQGLALDLDHGVSVAIAGSPGSSAAAAAAVFLPPGIANVS
jgi:hypothetical protein